MPYFGCHLSSAKGFSAMGRTAVSIGADTFQFFTRNPRGSKSKAWDPEDVRAMTALLQERSFGPLVVHAPYTINPCSSDLRVREFARQAMAEDLERLEAIPGVYYNFHPGSHVGQGSDAAAALIADTLNEVLAAEGKTVVLLETMAGKGTEVGRTFEELAHILEKTKRQERMGICLDTCHIFDGGYDIRRDLDGVLEEFDRILGLDRLKAVHLNDSLNGCGSRKDRHARLGEGQIGWMAIGQVAACPALEALPMILETPNDLTGYAGEIAALRGRLRQGSFLDELDSV